MNPIQAHGAKSDAPIAPELSADGYVITNPVRGSEFPAE